ncbi:MAG: Ldh family oxidoreductase [Spirochaetota bacterium]
MNAPPETHRRVSYEQMRGFLERCGTAPGLEPDRARLLAELLAGNDLRGNFSHGSVQMATYSRLMTEGTLNPRPRVEVVKQTRSSLLVDGDGGLGYFPSYDGTLRLIEKVAEAEIAVLVTRNHGHFGAAGLYARLAAEAGFCAYVTSGHQLSLDSESPHYAAAGGSPMAFGTPADPPVILDFGAMHDLYAGSTRSNSRAGPRRRELANGAPTGFRSRTTTVIC